MNDNDKATAPFAGFDDDPDFRETERLLAEHWGTGRASAVRRAVGFVGADARRDPAEGV